jgi:hypothetical protein
MARAFCTAELSFNALMSRSTDDETIRVMSTLNIFIRITDSPYTARFFRALRCPVPANAGGLCCLGFAVLYLLPSRPAKRFVYEISAFFQKLPGQDYPCFGTGLSLFLFAKRDSPVPVSASEDADAFPSLMAETGAGLHPNGSALGYAARRPL